MRILIVFAVFLSLSKPAAAAIKLLDCSFQFGEISQLELFQDSGGYSYRVLTEVGSWLAPVAFDERSWLRQDLSFSFRGERYRFFSADGKNWEYQVFSSVSQAQPSIVGTADCRWNQQRRERRARLSTWSVWGKKSKGWIASTAKFSASTPRSRESERGLQDK